METATKQNSSALTILLNGTLTSLKSVVPLQFNMLKPQLLKEKFHIQFGVFIGITGDIQGKLVLASEMATFGAIGEVMFGMPLEGEMLQSFSGELGNMVAGGLSTAIYEQDINIDITSPTIMTGDMTLSGYKQAIQVTTQFENASKLDIYLLMD